MYVSLCWCINEHLFDRNKMNARHLLRSGIAWLGRRRRLYQLHVTRAIKTKKGKPKKWKVANGHNNCGGE